MGCCIGCEMDICCLATASVLEGVCEEPFGTDDSVEVKADEEVDEAEAATTEVEREGGPAPESGGDGDGEGDREDDEEETSREG